MNEIMILQLMTTIKSPTLKISSKQRLINIQGKPQHQQFEINDHSPSKQETFSNTVNDSVGEYSSQKVSLLNFGSEPAESLENEESQVHVQPQPRTHEKSLLAQQEDYVESQSKADDNGSLENSIASRKLQLRHRRRQITLESLNLNIPIVERDSLERLNGFFARGGQACVWKGKMRGTEVAVKSFPKNDKSYMAFREMKLLTRIRHPNIVAIMAVSEGSTEYVLVMEFYDSYTLRQVIFNQSVKSTYNLNLHHKNHIVKQLCLALNFLHQDDNPIIHRDVKPENVLVEWTGEARLIYNIKLCDLGMSRCKDLIAELKTSENNCGLKGTEYYLAPELVKKQDPDTKSDVWAAACTILELYSGKETWDFEHSDIQKNWVAEAYLKGQRPKVKNVPSFIQRALSKCFQHDPSQRPSIQDILAIVEESV